MAKRKKDDTETAMPRVVTDHGTCTDCGNVVDVVVDIHQGAGNNRFLCVDCRCARIKEKAQQDAGAIQEKAKEARAAAAQGVFEFPKKGDDGETAD